MLCLQTDQEIFRKTAIIETGLSDHHKLLVSFFCTHLLKTLNTETIKNLIRKAFLCT